MNVTKPETEQPVVMSAQALTRHYFVSRGFGKG